MSFCKSPQFTDQQKVNKKVTRVIYRPDKKAKKSMGKLKLNFP